MNVFHVEQASVAQMQGLLNKVVLVRFENLLVTCIITDAKLAYGRVRVLITPKTGDGSQWIEVGRISEVIG